MKLEKVCPVCGVVFGVSPSNEERRKYCSQACNARKNFGMLENYVDGIPKMSPAEKEFNKKVEKQIDEDLISSVVPDAIMAPDYVPSHEELRIEKIKTLYKKGVKTYERDKCGVPIGEYDKEGNYNEY